MSRQLSSLYWSLTSGPNDHHVLSVCSRLSLELRLLLHDVSIRRFPGRWLPVFQSDIHFIDAALEGGRGTDLQLSYARAPDVVQSTRLTTRVMDFAAPNIDNKEAVSHDYNSQCHFLTPDPVYKRNALVNNNVPTCARHVLSEHVSLVIIGAAKESLADGLDEEQLMKDA